MRRITSPLAVPCPRFLLAAAALAAAAACGGDTPTGSSLGSIEITASTSGEDVDPDGYTVVVDGDETRSLGVDETVTSSDVPPGRYVLELTGVAENCEVEGENPRTVQVAGGETASTTFQVTCSGRTGQARVTTATSGDDPDSDGYTLTVDPGTEDSTSRSIGTNDEVTIDGLAEGEHAFELTDVANQCSVEGENTRRTAQVPFQGTAEVAYAVTCTSRTGDLEVSVTTTGEDQDDGYVVVVDGTQSQSIGSPDGSATFEGLAEGDHGVELTDVANNCRVESENPQTVTVPFDGTASASFTVDCTDAVGDLKVSASTTGDDQDTDGYEVVIDGTQSDSIGPDGSVVFEDVAEGDHQVSLTPSSVADNCGVEGSNPRTVTVTTGDTVSTEFTVDCDPALGGLEVTISTGGEDQDDGYDVTVDPGPSELSRSVSANDTTTFENLSAGDHEVELSGIAGNCTVGGTNPRTVTVPTGDTASTSFDVTCDDIPGDLEVSASTTGEDPDPDGYRVVMDPDSANERTDTIADPNGSITFTDVKSDDHTVEIDTATVAANCSVDSQVKQTVTVPEGGTASVSFDLSCDDLPGGLEVSASTTGDDQDSDGYDVVVDPGTTAEEIQTVGPNGTVVFDSLTSEEHVVELDTATVADNCTVDSANPDTVAVPGGDTVSVTFDVSCDDVPGDLEVSASTTGDDQDSDGYDVVVDPGTTAEEIQTVGPNGTVVFDSLTSEDHTVELDTATVADNCTVDSTNPQTVTVPPDDTATVAFDVSCDDVPGDLEATASTTGDDVDSDGYTVVVDAGTTDERSGTIAADGDTVTFVDLTSEDHTVEIDTATVADNCTVDSTNPQTVTVPPDDTATVAFDVSCDDVPGDLDVIASTTGDDLDSDGYDVQVDPAEGGPIQTVAANDTVTFVDLTSEDHVVELDTATVADNCTVDSTNPDTVTVLPDDTVETTFDLSCDAVQ